MKKKAIILLLCILFVLPLAACGGNPWPTTGLGAMLPAPSSGTVKIIINDDFFSASVDKAKADEFTKYISACEEMGYTVDTKKESASFTAFNKDGYKLDITAFSYDNSMQIDLNPPIKLSTLRWPSGELGKVVPKPESTTGKTEYEHEDSFLLYVGDTTQDQFNTYVEKCSDAGFNTDYDRGDKTYDAKNKDGYKLSLEYVGFNIMKISANKSDDKDDSNDDSKKNDNSSSSSSKSESAANNSSSSNKASSSENDSSSDNNDKSADKNEIRPEIKEAIDSYEAFIDEYCDFMRNYDSTSAEQLAQYTSFVTKELEMTRKFKEIEGQDLTEAEEDYYLEVQLRCSQKLLEVANSIN